MGGNNNISSFWYVVFLLVLKACLNASAQNIYYKGAIIRGDTTKKQLALVFTGHEFAVGARDILHSLKKQKVKSSFFLTGDFYRTFPQVIKKIKRGGHYLGSHSDKHLLYCDWVKRDSLLVSHQVFLKDLQNSYTELEHAGVKSAPYYLPPYEWYNDTISRWVSKEGLKLVNFTSGTLSHADYTTPDMSNYRSSKDIMESIKKYDRSFNGFHLLMHIGTEELRTDKFYFLLPALIRYFKDSGYKLVRIDELLRN